MDWLTKHKMIAGIVILLITAVAWYTLSGSSPESDAVLVTQSTQQIPPEAQDLLDSLHALQRVTLQGTVFSNPAFHVLKDFTTPVIPEPIGRTNPFAPLDLSVPVQTGSSTQ